jgi:hypothetical protein
MRNTTVSYPISLRRFVISSVTFVVWTLLFAALFGLGIFYTFWTTVFVPKLSFGTVFSSDERPSDDEIAGIKWQNAYSELDITIVNLSDRNYDDLNLRLKPNLFIAKIGCREVSGNAQVSFEPVSGQRVTPPSADLPLADFQLLATDGGYLMHCSRLPRKGHVTIVAAVVAVDLAQNRSARFEDFAMDFLVDKDTEIDGPYHMIWGYSTANICSERPTKNPCVAIDGTFTAAEGIHTISEYICTPLK